MACRLPGFGGMERRVGFCVGMILEDHCDVAHEPPRIRRGIALAFACLKAEEIRALRTTLLRDG
jgi:hypothetical protein